MTTMRLGAIPLLGKQVSMGDVYVGAGASVVGYALANFLNDLSISKNEDGTPKVGADGKPDVGYLGKLPDWLRPLVGPALAGGILFAAQHKKKPERAAGHLAGAIGVGLAMSIRAFATNVTNDARTKDLTSGKSPKDFSLLSKLSFAGVPVMISPAAFPGPTNMGMIVAAQAARTGQGMVSLLPAYRPPSQGLGRLAAWRAANPINGAA